MTSDGCWVQFYDGKQENDATKRFDGPLNVSNMDDYLFSDGSKGGDEPDSLVTGSRAWVQVWKDKDYSGKTAYFYPNQKIDDLDVYGVGGNISSFKLYDNQPTSFPPASTNNWATEVNGLSCSAETVNNLFRTTLGSALMLIPYVGSSLKTMLYGLWPDPKTNEQQAWAAFQNYISFVVGNVYQQIVTSGLSDKLQGLLNVTVAYVQAQPEGRLLAFGGLLTDLRVQEPFFINLTNPKTSLSFFLPFGSLYLLTLREEILFYEEIYGTPPSPEHRQTLVDQLQAKIEAYQKAIADARAQILAQRQTLVVLRDEGMLVSEAWRAVDMYSGWRGSQETGNGSKVRAQYAVDQRKEAVCNELAWQLDQNLAQTQLWSWMNPDNKTPIQAPEVIYVQGPYGSYQDSTAFSAVAAEGSAITRVDVRADSLIESLEVFIDGVSTGHNGGPNGALSSIVLAANEVIVRSDGYASGLINKLGFTTNLGQSFLVGSLDGTNGSTGTYVAAPPAGTTEGRLIGLSGYSLNDQKSSYANLKVLTYHWYCTLPLSEPSL